MIEIKKIQINLSALQGNLKTDSKPNYAVGGREKAKTEIPKTIIECCFPKKSC